MRLPVGDRTVAFALVAAVLLGIGGLYGALRVLAPPAPAPDTVTVRLTVRTASWTVEYEATTTNSTVLSLLVEAGEARGFAVEYSHWPELGAAFVEAIDGVRNGQQGRYWQYWVNGAYGDVGADQYVLADGDAVVWWHTLYPPEGPP